MFASFLFGDVRANETEDMVYIKWGQEGNKHGSDKRHFMVTAKENTRHVLTVTAFGSFRFN